MGLKVSMASVRMVGRWNPARINIAVEILYQLYRQNSVADRLHCIPGPTSKTFRTRSIEYNSDSHCGQVEGAERSKPVETRRPSAGRARHHVVVSCRLCRLFGEGDGGIDAQLVDLSHVRTFLNSVQLVLRHRWCRMKDL